MSRLRDLAAIGQAFAGTRWNLRFGSRDELLAWQRERIARFLATHAVRVPFYRDCAGAALDALPIVDKRTLLDNFDAFNSAGVTLDRALDVALAAERSRDFAPLLDGLTVGLSSGTSGTRGVFLVSHDERLRWAGVLLARLLLSASLRRLVAARGGLHAALFLRASSNLYTTLRSRRLRFSYHDLLEPIERHIERLGRDAPHVLVAPATVLRRLADAVQAGTLRLAPLQVIAVAEVLEADDAQHIAAAFGRPVQQIYQCTEGFLGYSCAHGGLHLNEEFVHIEPEWLDAEQTRFRPLVTDFSRTTQLIVRYRLDDVLRVAPQPCACGRVTRHLAAIEGRCDDVLWSRALHAAPQPVALFPDTLRRCLALIGAPLRDYRIEQDGDTWNVALDTGGAPAQETQARVAAEIAALCRRQDVRAPALRFVPFVAQALDAKRRRLRCVRKPATEAAEIHGVTTCAS